MTNFKKSLYTLTILSLVSSQVAFALTPKETAKYFNGPTVSQVEATSAQLSLSPAVLNDITEEEKAGVYFEYGETNQVCIMIYPTPEYCLPKKTEAGKTSVTISNLKPNTSYTVYYKRDNTIRCITAPCPENGFQSLSVEFITKSSGTIATSTVPTKNKYDLGKNLGFGHRGEEVRALQEILFEQGYLPVFPTGYFGNLTRRAVTDFQKARNIISTGFVGNLTRGAFMNMWNMGTSSSRIMPPILVVDPAPNLGGEKFEGKVEAYSTACFADGICSITVDGKTIVTTRGWSQEIVGQVKGIPDFGSIENNIGAHAKVYAKKTADGYTLYGNASYYVEITPKQGKLPSGSMGVATPQSVQSSTWVWQKTVLSDGSIVTPKKAGAFTLTFNADGNLSGKTDCNGFFGSYTFGSDGFIKFGALGSTLMFCGDSQEQVFTGVIAQSDRYGMDASGNLHLLLSGNAGTVYFVKQ